MEIARITLMLGTPARHDGLCPTCWTPALGLIPLTWLSNIGVHDAGSAILCEECGHWLSTPQSDGLAQ